MLTLILLRNGILLAVVLAVALSTASAQDESQFPYQALILNDDVTIRSGPDDSYYATDKLHRGTTVVVHRHHTGGWCAIGPPEGSFSLVPAAAVEVTDSNAGIVRGSDVQVWVGTCLGHVDDPHSQIMLRANQRVEILGEVSWPSPDGESTSVWYQVAPPEGELRWIQLSDLQLPSYLTVQPEPTSNADKTPAAQFNAQTIPEVDLGFSQNEIAPVSAQSVIEPMQGLSDPQLAQPNWLPQQTPTGSDFGQYGNNAIAPGNTVGDNPFVQSAFQSQQQSSEVGSNFYSTNDDFSQGLVVIGKDAALKIGGYVKLDLIYDFNPIDATDTFVVSSIPIGAPPRTNSRMHVRQTRLNFDTRWKTRCGTARAFVEGDFFGANNETDSDDFRLRQAFGELGRFLGGQTWTTFANIAAAPATLDFEGSISAITPRRAQVRWTLPVYSDDVTLALALEDSTTEIELPPGSTITGDTRTTTPDFVARLRRTGPRGNIQIAGIARRLGFQPTGEEVFTGSAWGLNFSQVADLSPDDKFYWQINYGDGIASLLGGLPDITPTGPDTFDLLGYFGWMAGATHDWNDRLSSNVTFAESHFRNTAGQPSTDINNLTYLAANLIWSPLEDLEIGIEYLYGKREDISGASGLANRIQFAVFYYLP